MDIQRVDPLYPTQRAHPLRNGAPIDAASDDLSFAPTARSRSRLEALPDVRRALVAALRHEIETGAYEDADKLQSAVEKLLDDLI